MSFLTAKRVTPFGVFSSAFNGAVPSVVNDVCNESKSKLIILSIFFRSLDESRLTALGVFDGNHRRAILNKASSGITSDLDNVLGDLDSAIKDLEAFSVVCTH